MEPKDVPQVAALCTALGYPTSAEEVARRFEGLLARPDNGMFVGQDEATRTVYGWLHVYGVRLLETNGYAEIGGLVVMQSVRKSGIGRALVRASESWAYAHSYDEVRLRSGLHRDEAHQFYVAIGYTQEKASYMFKRHTSPV